MISLHIDAVKAGHPIYAYISRVNTEGYRFTNEDADITIVALEDPSSERRIQSYLGRCKKVLVYFEHISSLVEVPAHVFDNPYFLGSISHSTDSVEQAKKYLPNSRNFYLPVGVPMQDKKKIEERLNSDHPITLLFWGSWNDIVHGNFGGRGGLSADEIFLRVRRQVDCRLIVRSPMRLRSMDEFPDSVQCVEGYQTEETLNQLHCTSDIYLLPSLQAHFASIPIAMSFGLPIVGNHNWGWAENVTDGYDGIIENSTTRGELCMERQHLDYNYVNLVSDRLIGLIQDRKKLTEMSLNALNTQLTKHDIGHYPEKLREILKGTNNG